MTTIGSNKKNLPRPTWLTEEVWPFDMHTAWIGDTPVTFTDEGSGPTLLLVHDGMWSFVWRQLIERLTDEFRVITLDFPGSGPTPATEAPVGIETDSVLLTRFVDEIGLDSLTLVVHDLGGLVGLGMAARDPARIDGLVLVNTFAWPPHRKGLVGMMRVLSSRPVTTLNVGTALLPRLTSSRFGVGLHLGRAERKVFRAPYRGRSARRRFHEIMRSVLVETTYLEFVEESIGATLREKPALSIYGERNDPFGFQEKFREYLLDIEEVVVPKGNHFPMCDDPDGIAAALRDWHARAVR